jgi:CubicO group peptidase (beta-lactamase class C family)
MLMKKITASLLLSVIVLSSFAQKQKPAEDKRFAGLDTAFARVLKDWKAAGFAVAVVEKDKVVYSKGFGYRDVENKVPATANTLFAIGSCTKAFTSSLLGMLNKDGKVDFDKPVRTYLPDLKFYNEEMNNKITLRDMMSHRTGLPRHDYSWYYFPTQSRDSLFTRIEYMEPTAGLRERWQYNNFMFFLQGVVTEKLTNKTWEENIIEKIFRPLGMDSAAVSVDEMQKRNDIAVGYGLKNDSVIKKLDYFHIDAMAPAGSINSSVNDMAKWVITWINGGKYKDKELLSASYVNEAMSSQMVIGGSLPSKERPDLYFSNYGFGWMLSSYKGHYRVEHGGNIDGFSASTCFFPSDSIGIIVLTNQNASAVTSIVRNTIADRMLKEKPINWLADRNVADAKAKAAAKEAEGTVEESSQKKGTKPSHSLKEFEGLYNHPGYGTIEIVLEKDSLFLLAPDNRVWLKHFHYDVFETYGVDPKEGIDTSQKSELRVKFGMSEAGEINAAFMTLEQGLRPLEFSRKPKPKEITKEELKKYEGTYELAPGTEAKFYIKGEKTLYAFIEGQPEYELIAIDKNKFALKALEGYTALFEENEKGEIIAVSFIQPNGTFKAPKKK